MEEYVEEEEEDPDLFKNGFDDLNANRKNKDRKKTRGNSRGNRGGNRG